MKALIPMICGAILATSCRAGIKEVEREEIFLERIVAMNGESTYPDPLILKVGGSRGEQPRSMSDAVGRLVEMMPLDFTASSKAEAAKACEFASSEQWASSFQQCSDVACGALPSRSRDLECGYLVRTNDWVEEQWLGGLCRIAATTRGDSPLFRWFSERKVTECFQMSEVITAATYRKAAGLPVDEAALIGAVK
ncbi:MAG: hypothetical protein U1F26_16775 [Lysobacterales bacterium]